MLRSEMDPKQAWNANGGMEIEELDKAEIPISK